MNKEEPKHVTERQIKFLRGCKTYGAVGIDTICNDPKCHSCVNIARIFKEVVQEQLNELKDER